MNIQELKSAMQDKHSDIWDVIYDSQKLKLVDLENAIESTDDPEIVTTLCHGYFAELELAARNYKQNIGNRFFVYKQKDFLSEVISKPHLFDSEGNYKVIQDKSIYSIPLFNSHNLDFCFGRFEDIKNYIVSELYVPMRRKDYSDWKIFNYLFHIRETQGFNLDIIKMLIQAQIIKRKINDSN